MYQYVIIVTKFSEMQQLMKCYTIVTILQHFCFKIAI